MPLLHLEPLSRGIAKSDLLAFLHTVGGLDRIRELRIDPNLEDSTAAEA